MYNVVGGLPFVEAQPRDWFLSFVVCDPLSIMVAGQVEVVTPGTVVPQRKVLPFARRLHRFVQVPRRIRPVITRDTSPNIEASGSYGFDAFREPHEPWAAFVGHDSLQAVALRECFMALGQALEATCLKHDLSHPESLLGSHVPNQLVANFGDGELTVVGYALPQFKASDGKYELGPVMLMVEGSVNGFAISHLQFAASGIGIGLLDG